MTKTHAGSVITCLSFRRYLDRILAGIPAVLIHLIMFHNLSSSHFVAYLKRLFVYDVYSPYMNIYLDKLSSFLVRNVIRFAKSEVI
jgi:hypothetical protein